MPPSSGRRAVIAEQINRLLEAVAAMAVVGFARVVTGVRGDWRGCAPDPRPRVYFANHSSNGDFVLIWTVLPHVLRRMTRPVAASDYWTVNPLRHFVAGRVFRAVLIDRNAETRQEEPVPLMAEAVAQGSSLIIFPEGKRNMTEERLLPFKTGIFHLAELRPDVEFVPTWIENLNRVMPKGELVPIPLLCTVTFGTPLQRLEGEDKTAFLVRAHAALSSLIPKREEDR